MLPPVSLPSAATHWLAATADAEPPLLPPGTRSGSQGLKVGCSAAAGATGRRVGKEGRRWAGRGWLAQAGAPSPWAACARRRQWYKQIDGSSAAVCPSSSPSQTHLTWYPEFSQLLPMPNSSMFVFPSSTAPAARSRETAVASYVGM